MSGLVVIARHAPVGVVYWHSRDQAGIRWTGDPTRACRFRDVSLAAAELEVVQESYGDPVALVAAEGA